MCGESLAMWRCSLLSFALTARRRVKGSEIMEAKLDGFEDWMNEEGASHLWSAHDFYSYSLMESIRSI